MGTADENVKYSTKFCLKPSMAIPEVGWTVKAKTQTSDLVDRRGWNDDVERNEAPCNTTTAPFPLFSSAQPN